MADSSSGKLASNKLYDVLKFVALILLPGLGTLYFALAAIWSLPNAQQVVGSITAIDTFLGLMIQYVSKQYNNSDAKYDGSIVLTETAAGKKVYTLEYDGDPAMLDSRDAVTFKIKGPAA